MNTLIKKLKLENIKTLALYSPFYIMLLCFITIFSWITNESALGISILLIIASIVLMINKDILPMMPCLIYSIYCTANNKILESSQNMALMIFSCIILVGAIIGHIILYPPKFKLFKLTIPLILVSLALMIGGLGNISFKNYLNSITFILSLGLLMLVLYYFISLYLAPPKSVDSKKYLCYIILFLGLVVFIETTVTMIRLDKPLIELMRNLLDVGWGNRNGIAMTLVLCSPIIFYLGFSSHKVLAYFYYLFSYILYLVTLFIFSRAGILAGTIAMFVLTIYSLAKGCNKSSLVYAIASIAILVAIIMLTEKDFVLKVIEKIEEYFSSGSSGRNYLYKEALALFLKYPLFGAGLGYIGNMFDVPPFCIYWFHSTPFQIIGCMGIVGIIAYSIFYIARGVIMFSNLKQFNIVLSIAIIGFEIHSMFDTGTFTPFPYMFIIIFLTAFLEYNNKQEETFIDLVDLKDLKAK